MEGLREDTITLNRDTDLVAEVRTGDLLHPK
jgi:hypothetical protein